MFLAVSEVVVVAAYHVVVQGCVGPSHVTHDQGAPWSSWSCGSHCCHLHLLSSLWRISECSNFISFKKKKIMSHQCSLPQIHVKKRTFTRAKNFTQIHICIYSSSARASINDKQAETLRNALRCLKNSKEKKAQGKTFQLINVTAL